MKFQPFDYQKEAIDWILNHKRAGLFLDMGLGKTVCVLTMINELVHERFEISKVLVIAPLRVASTVWAQEAAKWDHTSNLRVSVVLGSAKARMAALKTKADVYVINRENVIWLINILGDKWPFDLTVIDELSSFKNPSAKRFRALRKVIWKSKRVTAMTGTPSPNGLMDLWSEIFLLDKGERLGRTLTSFRETYFRPGWGNGYVVYNYIPLRGADVKIQKKLKDICISMKKEDYLDMPERVFIDVPVDLPAAALQQYDTLEREALLEIEDTTITALNAGAVNVKLQQMANGQLYKDDGDYVEIHEAKLDALEQLVEEAVGSPVLVFTSFRSDLKRIKNRLGDLVHKLDKPEDIKAWNEGKIPVAVAHPASIGHGLNLQTGGHIIVWYGLTWSLETYQQANDRLYRHGQTNTVSVYHLVARGTVDEAILRAIQKKTTGQNALLDYLNSRRARLVSADMNYESKKAV